MQLLVAIATHEVIDVDYLTAVSENSKIIFLQDRSDWRVWKAEFRSSFETLDKLQLY